MTRLVWTSKNESVKETFWEGEWTDEPLRVFYGNSRENNGAFKSPLFMGTCQSALSSLSALIYILLRRKPTNILAVSNTSSHLHLMALQLMAKRIMKCSQVLTCTLGTLSNILNHCTE